MLISKVGNVNDERTTVLRFSSCADILMIGREGGTTGTTAGDIDFQAPGLQIFETGSPCGDPPLRGEIFVPDATTAKPRRVGPAEQVRLRGTARIRLRCDKPMRQPRSHRRNFSWEDKVTSRLRPWNGSSRCFIG